MLNMILKEMSW